MQIAYFPYLMFRDTEEISFDNIKVWNFKKKAQEYIPDSTLRDNIAGLLATNKYGNQPIQDMGILSIGDIDFRPYSPAETKTVDEVRLLLFLTFLAQHNVMLGPNAGFTMATSENFSQVYQNFELANDNISESAGYIVNTTVAGYKVHETSFIAPSHLLKPWHITFDDDLLTQLRQLKTQDLDLYNRILRATDLLFESYFNNPNVSLNARILLQVGALEVLLDLPSDKQRMRLKDAIKNMTVLPGDKVETYLYETSRGKTATETASIKVKWADRFYSLRNHIIHGTIVPPTEFVFEHQRHTDIAVLFFVLLVKKLLNQKLGSTVFFDEIEWAKFTDSHSHEHDGFVYNNGAFKKVVNAITATKKI